MKDYTNVKSITYKVLKKYGKKVKIMKWKTEISSKTKKLIIASSAMLLILFVVIGLSIVAPRGGIVDKSSVTMAETEKNKDLESNELQPDKSSELGSEANVEEKELFLYDYKEVKDFTYHPDTAVSDPSLSYKPSNSMVDTSNQETEDNDKVSKHNKTEATAPDTSQSSNENIVIDESSTTIKDETKKNEYKGEVNQGKVEFFDVETSGKMPDGDVPAGGKQNVGNWN